MTPLGIRRSPPRTSRSASSACASRYTGLDGKLFGEEPAQLRTRNRYQLPASGAGHRRFDHRGHAGFRSRSRATTRTEPSLRETVTTGTRFGERCRAPARRARTRPTRVSSAADTDRLHGYGQRRCDIGARDDHDSGRRHSGADPWPSPDHRRIARVPTGGARSR